jgi:hypothetical protein
MEILSYLHSLKYLIANYFKIMDFINHQYLSKKHFINLMYLFNLKLYFLIVKPFYQFKIYLIFEELNNILINYLDQLYKVKYN